MATVGRVGGRFDPDGRYRSASAVLADPAFVGRADELVTLARLLDRAARVEGGLVTVEAV